MSHDTNTIDSRTHEGELNKLGFWIFITAEFALFGTLFATLLTLQHGGDYAGKMTTELFELPLVFNNDVCIIIQFLHMWYCYLLHAPRKTKVNDVLDDHYVTFRFSLCWIRNL